MIYALLTVTYYYMHIWVLTEFTKKNIKIDQIVSSKNILSDSNQISKVMSIRFSSNFSWQNPFARCILRKKKYLSKNKIFKRLIISYQFKFTSQSLETNLGPKRL